MFFSILNDELDGRWMSWVNPDSDRPEKTGYAMVVESLYGRTLAMKQTMSR